MESLQLSAPPLPPPPYTEQPSYPEHATGQAIPVLLPNGATLPGYQAPPSGVDIHRYQTSLNYPRQMFYQGASGGLVVTGVSVLLDICFNPKNSLAAFFCLFIYFYCLFKG